MSDPIPAGRSGVPDTVLRIRPERKRGMIGNKFSNINLWSYAGFLKAYPAGYFETVLPFVKEIQFMTATGGEVSRDLFRDPTNRSVMDDYDFSPLVNACRNVVDQGLKPVIKTGNVPLKYSAANKMAGHGVNMSPPDDYGIYFRYIQAMAQALADAFGLREVRTWLGLLHRI